MHPEKWNPFVLRSWFKEIKFYEQEIRNCEWSLEEVLLEAKSQADQAKAEHFQNQFILQRLQLQRLRKQLREVMSAPLSLREIVLAQVRDFQQYFKSLLKEFDQFLHLYFSIPPPRL